MFRPTHVPWQGYVVLAVGILVVWLLVSGLMTAIPRVVVLTVRSVTGSFRAGPNPGSSVGARWLPFGLLTVAGLAVIARRPRSAGFIVGAHQGIETGSDLSGLVSRRTARLLAALVAGGLIRAGYLVSSRPVGDEHAREHATSEASGNVIATAVGYSVGADDGERNGHPERDRLAGRSWCWREPVGAVGVVLVVGEQLA